MAKLVSKTYGDALFELALEKDILDDVCEEMVEIGQIWKDNRELADVMMHPRITIEEKVQIIRNIFDGRASEVVTGFLVTVIEKGRASELMSIIEYCTGRVREYNNTSVAYVSSAVELSDGQKEQIEKKLIDVTEYEKFEMNYSVDPELIGGMVIRIGDRVLDSSIKQKLNAMSRSLSGIRLN